MWNSNPDKPVDTPVPKMNFAAGAWKGYEAEYLAHALRSAQGRYNSSAAVPADKEDPESRAIYLDRVVDGYKEEAHEALQQEFQQWLMGQHPKANHGHNTYVNEPGKPMRRFTYRENGGDVGEQRDGWHHTPWGQSQLLHLPGVRQYFQQQYKAAMSKELELNLLADHGPQDIQSAWKYFLHWVKGRPYSETIPLSIPRSDTQENKHRAFVADQLPDAMHEVDYRQYRDNKGPPPPVDVVHETPLEEYQETLEQLQREQEETGNDMTEQIQAHVATEAEVRQEEDAEIADAILAELENLDAAHDAAQEEQANGNEEEEEEEEEGEMTFDQKKRNSIIKTIMNKMEKLIPEDIEGFDFGNWQLSDYDLATIQSLASLIYEGDPTKEKYGVTRDMIRERREERLRIIKAQRAIEKEGISVYLPGINQTTNQTRGNQYHTIDPFAAGAIALREPLQSVVSVLPSRKAAAASRRAALGLPAPTRRNRR